MNDADVEKEAARRAFRMLGGPPACSSCNQIVTEDNFGTGAWHGRKSNRIVHYYCRDCNPSGRNSGAFGFAFWKGQEAAEELRDKKCAVCGKPTPGNPEPVCSPYCAATYIP